MHRACACEATLCSVNSCHQHLLFVREAQVEKENEDDLRENTIILVCDVNLPECQVVGRLSITVRLRRRNSFSFYASYAEN